MGATLVCAVTFKVLEGNYAMVYPHLKTLFWSVYFSLALSRIKKYLVMFLQTMGSLQLRYKIAAFAGVAAIYLGVFIPLLYTGARSH